MSALIQGTPEWLALRRTKVTSSDAAIIMGMNPWENVLKLYENKLSGKQKPRTAAMDKGIRLEPIARAYYTEKTKRQMEPKVIIKDWAMTSLDGIASDGRVLEIKCPGEKVHMMAKEGKVPDYYYPRIQHHMFLSDSGETDYMSYYEDDYTGEVDVAIFTIERNQEFIDRMIPLEKEFWDCLESKTPPKLFNDRTDERWIILATEYLAATAKIAILETTAEAMKNELIQLAGESGARGAGISISKVERKGLVDYSRIPQLNGIDLEEFRKPSSQYWKIAKV